MSKSAGLLRLITTYRTIVFACVAAGAGVGLLYWAGREDLWQHRDGARALSNALGALLIVSFALGVLWELAGKRAFAREILAGAAAGADVEAMGLVRIGMNYVEVPDWEELFSRVHKLDIYFAYGRTWRNNQLQRLEKLAATPGSRIRVYLPDPADTATIIRMSERFGGMAPDTLIAAIEEARAAYAALPATATSTVEVYYRAGESLFSCYRFDTTAVLTLYSHQGVRTGVPTFVCRDGGALYQFIRSEFHAIAEQSRLVYPPASGG